jgi:hypothetical protein
MAQDVTQQHPNARWWNGANVAGGGRAASPNTNNVGGTTPDTGTQYSGAGPGTVYVGRNAAGVSKNQPGPNVAGAPRSVNNS